MAKKKRGPGRPALRPGERRDLVLRFRVTPEEKLELEAAPERDGVADFSDWARDVLLARARELQAASTT